MPPKNGLFAPVAGGRDQPYIGSRQHVFCLTEVRPTGTIRLRLTNFRPTGRKISNIAVQNSGKISKFTGRTVNRRSPITRGNILYLLLKKGKQCCTNSLTKRITVTPDTLTKCLQPVPVIYASPHASVQPQITICRIKITKDNFPATGKSCLLKDVEFLIVQDNLRAFRIFTQVKKS